jgi:membrane-associated phospholipid phosphatase
LPALAADGTSSELRATESLTRGSLRIVTAYLFVTVAPLLRWSWSAHSWSPIVFHLLALVAVAYLSEGDRAARSIREWVPLALVPLLYVELRWVIVGMGRPHADTIMAAWDVDLFGADLSRTLALRWHSVALSELLHLCYISYYAIVYVPPALLWLRGRQRAFATTVYATIVVYTICFISCVLLPVDGPRFLSGPSAAPEGPIRAIVVRILEAGSSRGTAFPSAHVAASVVAGICALRFQRRIGVAIVMLTAGMMVGAVYGGYHYAVDVLAGLVVGLVAAAIARAAERSITARSTRPG